MAGRIRRADIDEVRQRVNIADVVGQYVALKRAGVDSQKGLFPFHDEKSPSFHVRPNSSYFNCFGCGEKGDVFTFLEKIDHLSFTEAVERLAAQIGFQLTYEDGGPERDVSQRARILEANAAAEQFFVDQLATPEARLGQDFLTGRGFDRAACDHFRVGFGPNSYDALIKHLKAKKFTEEELEAAGLVSRGDRGIYDRFRGRLIWPIRDVTGATIGFGARRLRDDDQGPKYLNTAETSVYHKAKALYGIDLAKRSISKDRRVVVVEGYTDVMACHVAGITTAVATCGTAFGSDHVSLIRRILGDVEAGDQRSRGEVIFTFDPDEAGQKAASKAFAEDAKFAANTFVAVAPDGLDPCDLRMERGDESLRSIIDTKIPMFEFIIRRTLVGFDLNTVEGRVQATRAVAPVIAGIKDRSLVDGYIRVVSGWIGVEPGDIQSAMRGNATVRVEVERDTGDAVTFKSLAKHPQWILERDVLVVALQYPGRVGIERAGEIVACHFDNPALSAIRTAMVGAFGAFASTNWVSAVIDGVDESLRGLVGELATVSIPVRIENTPPPANETPGSAAKRVADDAAKTEQGIAQYVLNLTTALLESDIARQRTELIGVLQRTPETSPDFAAIQRRIAVLEEKRRSLQVVT
ncbi:MAG: DNA primase [Microbacteriaceae bacterium]